MQRKHKLQALIIAVMVMFVVFTVLFLKTDADINRSNIEYINGFGWEVDEKPVEIVHITMPDASDEVLTAYSEKLGGKFNPTDLEGKRVTRYSYKVLNHIRSNTGSIRINLIVYNKTVICADVSSVAENGFIIPIDNTSDAT